MDQIDPVTNELLIGGFVLPLVLALLMQCGWSQPVRAIVFALACIGTAALVHWQEWNDLASFGQSLIFILVAAGSLYRSFWKPVGIAPAIERATSVPTDG